MDLARQARVLAPDAPGPLEQQASLFADHGDLRSLESVVREMRAKFPDRAGTHYYAATARFMAGDPEGAATLAAAAASADPAHARARTVLGAAYASLGRRDQARAAFRNSISIDPREGTAWTNLGLLELNAGDAREASRLFAESLTVDPRQPAAIAGLAEALDRQGFAARAATLRSHASLALGRR